MPRPSKMKLAAKEREKWKSAARRRLERKQRERKEMDGKDDIIKVEPEEDDEVSSRKINHDDDTTCCNLGPLSSSCFVCVQPLTSSSETRPKVTETEYICLLTDMLGLARSQSNNYLKQISEPEKWIGLCHECLNLIKEVEDKKELINKIRREIKHRQQQIVNKMKGTQLNLRIRGSGAGEQGNNASNEGRALKAVRNILNFVHRRQQHSISFTDNDDPANSNKEQRTSTEPQQLPLQPSIPKKKTVVPLKLAKLAAAPLKPGVVSQRETARIEKSDRWRGDCGEEAPIFLNPGDHRMEEAFAVTDPLAIDDDADCIVNKPCSAPQSQVYYCGLCSDDEVYRSEEQLQLHTNQVHRPDRPGSPPSKKVRRMKRQRKQRFSAGSEEEFEAQPVKKRKASRPLETVSASIVFTTSKRRSNAEDEEVKPIVSGNDDHDDPDSDSDPEEEEQETGKNPEKDQECKKAKPVHFQYDCPNCPDVKKYGLCRFAQHLAIHQRRPYRCSMCSALFPSDELQMEEHWKKTHSHVEAATTTSEKKFTRMTLDPGEIWRCQSCPSRFSKEEDRDAHALGCSSLQTSQTTQSVSKMVLSPDLIHSCQICDKPFRSFDEWRLHRVLHHPDVDRLSCLLCELSFAEKTVEGVEARDDLKMLSHIKQYHYAKGHHAPVIHPQRVLYECEECGLVFNFGVESSAHFLSVHGSSRRVVPCTVSCGRWYADFEKMRRHVKYAHFLAGLSVCDECGSSFKYLDTMVEHKLRKHGLLQDDYSPVFTCPAEGCGYRTVKQQALHVHSQMAHGVARKYICKSCGKGFSNSGKLRRHEQIHDNNEKKPYQCEVCGNSFAVRNYLYIHMRLSHENRKFPSTNRKRDPKKTSTNNARSQNKKVAASLGNSTAEAVEETANCNSSGRK